MTNREEIINSYDSLVYESREGGVPYQSIITAVTDKFVGRYKRNSVSIPAESQLDVPELIYDSVRFHIQQTRGQRRQYLKDVFDDLGDKAEYPVGSKPHEAAKRRLIVNFERAFPLGTDEGTDKALGAWHLPDVYRAIESRRENVAKQQAALEQFEAAAARAVRAIEKGEWWS